MFVFFKSLFQKGRRFNMGNGGGPEIIEENFPELNKWIFEIEWVYQIPKRKWGAGRRKGTSW